MRNKMLQFYLLFNINFNKLVLYFKSMQCSFFYLYVSSRFY